VTRDHDLVVYGATGYTGKLLAAYLARRADGLRWALAGRDPAKLEAVAGSLGLDLPLLHADAGDPASMAALAASTRAVVTTVGPYALHGDALVDACVEAGTHCCDISGEVPWVRAVIDRHHEGARERGVRLVSMCGYDSVPSDLGCLLLQQAVHERHGRHAPHVDALVGPTRGGVSGGTIASASMMVERRREPGVAKHLMNRGALTPGFRPAERPDTRGIERVAGGWGAPFLMAGINGRVVHRTNALLGRPWGDAFVYREQLWCGSGPSGLVRAVGLLAFTAAFVGGMTLGPTRALLRATVLPDPGQGPSEESRRRGFFRHRLIARDGDTVLGRLKIEADLDPGYAATAAMLAECTLQTLDPATDTAGVLTPAHAFGAALRPRLEAAGFRFTVET
jgi:short subunit dehydrogenase-like uncharacterized protein